jgi:hypothetical protein
MSRSDTVAAALVGVERTGLSGPPLLPFVVRPRPELTGRPPAPTGLGPLDALLQGGFPRGCISELVGPRASGRTSVLLRCLACATAAGALAALVDVADSLDPASAVAAGIALPHLLWVRCGGRPDLGLKAADVIVRGGGFGVVAVDLGDAVVPGARALVRVPPAAFVRLQRGVEKTPAALLLAGPERSAGSLAAVAVTLRQRGVRWLRGGPGFLAGLSAEARVVRARGRAPGAAAVLEWPVCSPWGGATAAPPAVPPATVAVFGPSAYRAGHA